MIQFAIDDRSVAFLDGIVQLPVGQSGYRHSSPRARPIFVSDPQRHERASAQPSGRVRTERSRLLLLPKWRAQVKNNTTNNACDYISDENMSIVILFGALECEILNCTETLACPLLRGRRGRNGAPKPSIHGKPTRSLTVHI